jgi:TM2 domain-containing membrane protein YozV
VSDTSQGAGWWQASDGKWYPGGPQAGTPAQFCTNCAAPVHAGAAACVSCGFNPMAQRNFCSGCGAATLPGQVVCTSCGRAVGRIGSGAPVPGQYGDKNKIAAGLLGIFLGAFGVHKFYLGRTNPAVVMLVVSLVGAIVTLGIATAIMGIIGLVEGIIYLTKTDEQFYEEYVVQGKDWF